MPKVPGVPACGSPQVRSSAGQARSDPSVASRLVRSHRTKSHQCLDGRSVQKCRPTDCSAQSSPGARQRPDCTRQDSGIRSFLAAAQRSRVIAAFGIREFSVDRNAPNSDATYSSLLAAAKSPPSTDSSRFTKAV
jgi:hypothetical protein